MTFTVFWLPDALNELADVWMAATDRAAVTAASNRIDRRLATDPISEGESREGADRITFDGPLQLAFRVYEADRRVEVRAVAAFGRR